MIARLDCSSTIFREILPREIKLNAVDVRVLPPNDKRIEAVRQLANTAVHTAREVFAEPCVNPPPLPSNKHYDAKLWRYIATQAQAGDLWWNVAR